MSTMTSTQFDANLEATSQPFGRFRMIRHIRHFVKHMDHAAAWEAGKNVFAVLGIGTVLADVSTMRVWFVIPSIVLVTATWYGFYRQYDGK